MGLMLCCKTSLKRQTNGKQLFLLKYPEPFTLTSSTEINEEYNSRQLFVCVYDVMKNKAYKRDVTISILNSLEGISQAEYNNIIYLCGNQNEEDLGGSSSFFISIDPFEDQGDMHILLSTIAHHYYPSMIALKNDLILAIGGKAQTICESYSISQQKWKEIAKLPDGRYQASILHDNANQLLYLFGGYNHLYEKCNSTILTMETKHFSNWDTILLKEGNDLMAYCCSGLLLYNDNTIIVFGGKNSKGIESRHVIEYNIKKRSAKLQNKDLGTETFFPLYLKSIKDNDSFILFFDVKAQIYHAYEERGELSIRGTFPNK